MTLPDLQNICCSPIFYDKWKISQHWSHCEVEFMQIKHLRNISEENWEKQPVKNYINQLLKKKRGGVIFIGLTLYKSVATVEK